MKETKKRILVTGGAGFIGSHIVDAYIKLGHQVLIIDNLSSGKMPNVNSNAEFVLADITNVKLLKTILTKFKPQIINHHAAHILVGDSVKNPQFDAQINILGTLNLLESTPKDSLEHILMASTGGAIYGDKKTPFTEQMNEQPLSPYGISKKAGELYLHYYYKQYGIPYTILRYANVYGPRQNAHGESGVIAVFSDLISQNQQPIINGDGTHTRDYVFIEDVVRANMLATTRKYCGKINIGTKTEYSTNSIFEKIVSEFKADIQKKYGPERPGEQVTSSLSFDKAERILGWHPTVGINEGIKKTTEWYKR